MANALQPQTSVINVFSNFIWVRSRIKAVSSVYREKLLKEYFHHGYPYAAIFSLLERRHLVRMHVRIKRKLKNRPRKLRPVRRCFLSTFALIKCRSFILRTSSQSNNIYLITESEVYCIDLAIARSIRQGLSLRFSRNDRTVKVIKLFILCHFCTKSTIKCIKPSIKQLLLQSVTCLRSRKAGLSPV